MSREMLNLKNAAEHVHMDANELRHVAQRGEIEFDEHGGDLWFEHRALDEWAQRNLLSAPRRELAEQHRNMTEERRRASKAGLCVADLFDVRSIDLFVRAKAKAGILKQTQISFREPESVLRKRPVRERTVVFRACSHEIVGKVFKQRKVCIFRTFLD